MWIKIKQSWHKNNLLAYDLEVWIWYEHELEWTFLSELLVIENKWWQQLLGQVTDVHFQDKIQTSDKVSRSIVWCSQETLIIKKIVATGHNFTFTGYLKPQKIIHYFFIRIFWSLISDLSSKSGRYCYISRNNFFLDNMVSKCNKVFL